jgi:hypothetical protein
MNLFAALRVHTGETHAMTSTTPNSQDLIRFLDEIDDTIAPAAGRQIIAIMDNLSTHKSTETKSVAEDPSALALRSHPQPRRPAQPGLPVGSAGVERPRGGGKLCRVGL